MEENEGISQNGMPETIKLKHRQSPNFIGDYATGAIFSGPSPDGLYHLIFFSDTVEINSETLQLAESSADADSTVRNYQSSFGVGDLENFREDKARISLTHQAIIKLRDLLISQIPLETANVASADEQPT